MTSFAAFVDEALSIADQHVIHDLGPVGNAPDIMKAVGVDLSGWSRRVDNYALHYAIKHHSVPALEEARGQVAITPADLRRVRSVVTRPDRVIDGGLSSQGLRVIVSEKTIGGEILCVSEQMRGRKHRTVVILYNVEEAEKAAVASGGKMLVTDVTPRPQRPKRFPRHAFRIAESGKIVIWQDRRGRA